MAKDPKRQLLGKIARQKGQYFEHRLDSTFDYYRERGYAEIEKTPEPMKVIKPEGNGRFLACYTKKAQVDYKGTLKGGRTVLFEAKFTATDRLTQDRVIDKQASYMDRHQRLGARCGRSFIERKENTFCPTCRLARKKKAQRHWCRVNGAQTRP